MSLIRVLRSPALRRGHFRKTTTVPVADATENTPVAPGDKPTESTLPWLRDAAGETAFKAGGKAQPPLFDTYAVVMELKLNGFSERQAVSVKEALDQAIRTSLSTKLASLATQSQLSNVESTLKESLFNFSLKYDMQQRHSKELLKADIDGLKVDNVANAKTVQADFQAFRSEAAAFRSEIRHLLKTDVSLLEQQLLRLQKEVDAERADFKAAQGVLENKLIKYGMGVMFSLSATVLAFLRLMN